MFNRFTSLINPALSTVACISIETAQDSIVLLACTGNLHKQSFIIKSLFDFIQSHVTSLCQPTVCYHFVTFVTTVRSSLVVSSKERQQNIKSKFSKVTFYYVYIRYASVLWSNFQNEDCLLFSLLLLVFVALIDNDNKAAWYQRRRRSDGTRVHASCCLRYPVQSRSIEGQPVTCATVITLF